MPRLPIAALLLTLLIAPLIALAPAAAKQQSQQDPDVSVGQCIEGGGADEQEPGSPIRTCCMDSDITGVRGCYICNYKWEDCVWDPAYGGKDDGKPDDKGHRGDHIDLNDLAPSTD